jgi:hypothetical protein
VMEGSTSPQPQQKKQRPPNQASSSQLPKPRPPFRAITNTAPTFSHVPTSTQHGKRPASRRRPEWGARRPVPKAGLIPMMMPNGEMGYVVPEAWS